MSLTTIIIFLEIIFSTLVFLVLAVQTFRGWQSFREEVLLHSTVFFIALAVIVLVFSIYVYPNIFELTIDVNMMIIVMGLLYDLFYLEISIIYLSIFSNSRTIFESYAPFIIGAVTVINIFSEISDVFINNLYFVLFFHAIVITIGITLILLGVRHLSNSKKYINNDKELAFIQYIVNIGKYVPILLIMDGLGFLFFETNAEYLLNISEMVFLIEYTLITIFSILIYLLAHSIAKKAKELNLPKFMNTIS